MPSYRIVAFERASVKHVYRIEAPTPEDARKLIQEGDADGVSPDPIDSDIHEYSGDIFIESITEAK